MARFRNSKALIRADLAKLLHHTGWPVNLDHGAFRLPPIQNAPSGRSKMRSLRYW